MSATILRMPAVKLKTGLSKATIYLRIKQNSFPRSIELGGRAVGWLESDIETWIEEKVKESRSEHIV